MIHSGDIRSAADQAANWLTGPALVRDGLPVGPRGVKMFLKHWNGAIRGEYRLSQGKWDSFCPIWHTGQAVKALVMAAKSLRRPELLETAKFCAGFLLENQYCDGEDAGMLPAFEDFADKVNTSAILEALDGLFLLSEATGSERYSSAAVAALEWVARKTWDADAGEFFDIYDPVGREIVQGGVYAQKRPLLDDAVFLRGWQVTGRGDFLKIALRTADRLLETESPKGNWKKYHPCVEESNDMHPRQVYWWGNPMLALFEETGNGKYLECFLRSADYCGKALRRDGGVFRRTYCDDFNTESFGHAASASACYAKILLEAERIRPGSGYGAKAQLALDFCRKMQLTDVSDERVKGAILEKVLAPDGSDRLPYHIRDLGSIFFLQAACQCCLV
ncbi:MAG: hypothetical protein PHS41_02275 [Victivallaceae bacterium]|nr:hypothetical protein [Victivallaceae bacterium]